MNTKKEKIITIILIIAWMTLVFYFSNQVSEDSSKLSGEITQLILNFFHLLDGSTHEQQLAIETAIRKLAHYSIYILGGILILLHVNLYNFTTNKKVIITWLIGTAYAVTDEVHQLFIPGRSCEIRDVCIDSLGVITGIIILLIILNCKKRRLCRLKKEGNYETI